MTKALVIDTKLSNHSSKRADTLINARSGYEYTELQSLQFVIPVAGSKTITVAGQANFIMLIVDRSTPCTIVLGVETITLTVNTTMILTSDVDSITFDNSLGTLDVNTQIHIGTK